MCGHIVAGGNQEVGLRGLMANPKNIRSRFRIRVVLYEKAESGDVTRRGPERFWEIRPRLRAEHPVASS